MFSKQIYADLSKFTKPLLELIQLNKIYEHITKSACALMKASASLLMLYDEKEKKLYAVYRYNLTSEYQRLAHAEIAYAAAACAQKRIRFIKDIKKLHQKGDAGILALIMKQNIASMVSAPLGLRTSVFGCINIYYHRHLEAFKNRDILTLFTEFAALAIVRAHAANRLREHTRMVKGLEDIGKKYASSFELSEMTHLILSTAASALDTNTGGIIIIDEKNKTIVNAYEYKKETGKTKEYKSTARLQAGISGETLRTRKPVVISDLSAYPDINPVAIKKRRISLAAIPLIAREKVIGILFLDSYTPRTFTQKEIDYLTMLSGQAAIALDNTILNNIVTRETKETALLYEVSQSLISTLDFDQLLKNILQHLKDTFGFLNVSVLLVDVEKGVLYTHSSITRTPADDNLKLKIGKDGITGHVAKLKRMYYSPDVRNDTYYVKGNERTRSEVCFPLLIGERLIGVLDVESSEVNGFSQEAIRLLSSLSAQIAIAIDNARLYAETKKLSLTDPLTQLSNRRSFDISIDAEIKRAERYRRTFVVMMIDFDNFKNYNDKYGHTAGDIVLQKLSRIMKDIIRDVDFLCRYGGDEFVAILPETDASFALDVAERMRKKIAAQKIHPKITLSVGIASFPHDARDEARLIDLADQACYEAKQRGGNRVLFTFKPKEHK